MENARWIHNVSKVEWASSKVSRVTGLTISGGKRKNNAGSNRAGSSSNSAASLTCPGKSRNAGSLDSRDLIPGSVKT
jgi:hypothetical protein